MHNFADRLLDAIDMKQNPSIIGLDTDLEKVPAFLRKEFEDCSEDPFEAAAECIVEFNRVIIDNIRDIVPAVKLQSAFYEQCGSHGIRAFSETARYAAGKGLIVVGDVKRGDIGSTSGAYSNAFLGKVPLFGKKEKSLDLDCITVNPYLGSDGILPFVEDCKKYGKGIFVLVKTSNPSSGEVQDLVSGGRKVYERVAELVGKWGSGLAGKRGYSPVGAVVGATYPKEAAALRRTMPKSIFLVPGYGAQGGGARDVAACFNTDGYGAIVHSARDVIFAYQKAIREKEFGEAARQAAEKMKEEIASALGKT